MVKYAFTEYEGTFYTTSVTVTSATTYSTASDQVADVLVANKAYITVQATGSNASASGVMTFSFVGVCSDDQSYPTESDFDITVTLSGTSTVRAGGSVDVEPYSYLKVLSIANADATYDATGCNATLAYKH